MKTTRQLLLIAAVSALLGACSRTQTPEPPQTNAQQTSALKLSGTVADAAGSPVAGAAVEYWSYGGNFSQPGAMEMEKQITVGADGAFEFQVPSNTGFLVARKPGLAPAWKSLGQPFNPTSETGERFVLIPPTALAGVVVDESNQPVANAEVFVALAANEISLENGGRAFNYLAGKPARDCFAARTDAAGHFRIGNFPANANAALAVHSPGKVLRQSPQESISFDSLPCHAGQQDIQLIVEPAGSIEGKIIGGETNQPPPIARLTLQPDEGNYFMRSEYEPMKSGADGAFRFDDVAAGSYHVRAVFGTNAASGWVAQAVPVSVESGQVTRGVEVTAQRGALLEVSVLDEADHKPVARVNVSAYRENSQSSAETDGKGVARLCLLPGDYQIYASRQSMTSSQTSATVEAGVTNRVEIEIAGPQKITGIVRAPDGKPVAAVVVRIVGAFGAATTDVKTDANGKFEMEWNQRQFGQNNSTPCILVRDAEHNLAAAQDLDEDTTNVDLKLAPGLTLAGRAECDGKPVTNATAQLVFWTGRSGMWLQGLARTNTPAPGRFEIPALPPGRRYGVIVTAPGYGQKQLFNFDVSADAGRQELDPVEIKLANLKLSGQVLDADDKPVANCYVNLSGDDQPNDHVRTDREGRFTFEHVCEGAARLFANSQRSYGSISAEGGDTNVVLQLGQNYSSSPGATMHKLKGSVTDADGKPDASAQVAVFPNNGTRWVKTGPNGEYNLTWSLQPWQSQSGEALLVVRDTARNLAASGDLSEDVTNLDVKLKPALTLTGQVKGADDSPLHNAQVGLWLRAGNSYDQLNEQMTAVNAEGRFEIKCLPPEPQYLVYATAKGYGRNQQQIGPGTETNRLELAPFVLKPADRVIAGQVLDANDKPASGVDVRLMNVIASGEGQPEGNTTTDRNGKFRLQVCEGQVRLYANSRTGNGYAQATVEAGDTNIVINLRSSLGNVRQPQRASLKGGPLPDLTTVNLAADAAPAGKLVLLCLFDAGQRPSRHVVNLLEQQAAALQQKNVAVLGVQAAVTSDDVFSAWKAASPVSFPVGRVTEKSAKTRWAMNVSALPWLILTDASHRVVAEGFSLDELDAQLQKLTK
jgi:protocatechuate 3,4-dioxygenase beta subunit/5-hydroxyisourate hydrolase-like protein (transthyretin family)